MKYLFVDFDNTIVKTNKRCVELLNAKFNKNVNYHRIRKYDFSDWFPEASKKDVDSLFENPLFFEGLELYEDAKDSLLRLSKILNPVIVTIGTKKNLEMKKVWLSWNLPFITDIIGLEDNNHSKASVDMSDGILIDDHINCLRSSNAKIKFLYYSQPAGEWQHMRIDDKFYVSDDWNEIAFYIKERFM